MFCIIIPIDFHNMCCEQETIIYWIRDAGSALLKKESTPLEAQSYLNSNNRTCDVSDTELKGLSQTSSL